MLASVSGFLGDAQVGTSIRRRLGEIASSAELKLAFKVNEVVQGKINNYKRVLNTSAFFSHPHQAMKLNTKYELASEQKTILRGGTIAERHTAAVNMKANIYLGIKDMKKVMLAGLTPKRYKPTMSPVSASSSSSSNGEKVDKKESDAWIDKWRQRRTAELAREHSSPRTVAVATATTDDANFNDDRALAPAYAAAIRRKLPGVHTIKGAYKVMKGQIKTSMLMVKQPLLLTPENGGTFDEKHATIHDLKQQVKGAILQENAITLSDDEFDDDTSGPPPEPASAVLPEPVASDAEADLKEQKDKAVHAPEASAPATSLPAKTVATASKTVAKAATTNAVPASTAPKVANKAAAPPRSG
jgi:hypothetical protein